MNRNIPEIHGERNIPETLGWSRLQPSERVHVFTQKGHVCRIFQVRYFFILLMEEILHHLGCVKPCAYWGKLPTVSTGAGFLPSTV